MLGRENGNRISGHRGLDGKPHVSDWIIPDPAKMLAFRPPMTGDNRCGTYEERDRSGAKRWSQAKAAGLSTDPFGVEKANCGHWQINNKETESATLAEMEQQY